MRRPRRRQVKSPNESHDAELAIILPSGTRPVPYGALVTGGSRLSEGAIIHAAVAAQLLGLKVLRLEARIEATPAQLERLERLPPSPEAASAAQPAARSHPKPQRYGDRTRHLRAAREPIIGSRLKEAMDLLAEGAEGLATAGDNKPPERT